ncbi:MAG: hypothetical protein HXY18_20280, partial [Bryobacteraceae bacterium]|nr:hypothetical protein [Bryobacteraceae bacterium]
MHLLVIGLAVVALSGVVALFAGRVASRVAALGCVAGSLVGLVPALQAMGGHPFPELRPAWALPLGEFHLALDALSGWFLAPIFVLASLAAIYGLGYFAG